MLADDALEEVQDEATFLVFLQAYVDEFRLSSDPRISITADDFLEKGIAWAKLKEKGAEEYEMPANPWRRMADIIYFTPFLGC